MSYLQYPRLCFAGSFQADVSTVNNDPRHFDSETFQERFQEFQSSDAFNGWWNPIGTGIFRLAGCTVRSGSLPDGTAVVPTLSNDPVLALGVGNSPDHPSGKLVDLDPDWQLASQIYGFSVSLVDPATGTIALLGDYRPAPFRDLWFGRSNAQGDSGASATFQSALTNLRWNDEIVERSPLLSALRDGAKDDLLSIRMVTYAYDMAAKDATFTYGTVVGAIGLLDAAGPSSFVYGRRLMPATQNAAQDVASILDSSANTPNLGFMPAVVQGNTLHLDMANASRLAKGSDIAEEPTMNVAILADPSAVQGTLLEAGQYQNLGALAPKTDNQLEASGIRSYTLTDDQLALVADHPIAVVKTLDNGQAVVTLREGTDGLNVMSEDFSFRLDPNDADYTALTTTFYATSYGKPLAGAKLRFWLNAVAPDMGNAPPSAAPGATPTAPLTYNNTPPDSVTVIPDGDATNAAGELRVTFTAPKIMGWPRKYIDGQVYVYSYNFVDRPSIPQNDFDKISILAFSSIGVPAEPTWDDVQPILQQYANLYPVMSQRIFNFADQAQADANAHLLLFVFSKNVLDPDYMPVTRDLSAGRREILIRYFRNVLKARGGDALPIPDRIAARCPFAIKTPVFANVPVETVGKRRPA